MLDKWVILTEKRQKMSKQVKVWVIINAIFLKTTFLACAYCKKHLYYILGNLE